MCVCVCVCLYSIVCMYVCMRGCGQSVYSLVEEVVCMCSEFKRGTVDLNMRLIGWCGQMANEALYASFCVLDY